MLQAAKLIICQPKLKIYKNFQTAITGNQRNMFIVILLSFFITYFANFIKELPNSMQAETYSEPYQRFKMLFWAKIVNSSRGIFRMELNIEDQAFWEKDFQLSTISVIHFLQRSSILDVRLHSKYASRAINYFQKMLHLDVWLGSRFASDMFKERQKLQKSYF